MILFDWISLNLAPLSIRSATGTGRGRLYLSTVHLFKLHKKNFDFTNTNAETDIELDFCIDKHILSPFWTGYFETRAEL